MSRRLLIDPVIQGRTVTVSKEGVEAYETKIAETRQKQSRVIGNNQKEEQQTMRPMSERYNELKKALEDTTARLRRYKEEAVRTRRENKLLKRELKLALRDVNEQAAYIRILEAKTSRVRQTVTVNERNEIVDIISR